MRSTGRLSFITAALILTAVAALVVAAPAIAASKPAGGKAAKQVEASMHRILRADYEADQATLDREFDTLAKHADSPEVGAEARYWRGFARWRQAINGFNDGMPQDDMAARTAAAADEFSRALERDPAFADARAAMAICRATVLFYLKPPPADLLDQLGRWQGELKRARDEDPENPRTLWLVGGTYIWTPPEQGGSFAKGIAVYERGLAAARGPRSPGASPLRPTWGEPELLMSLAWARFKQPAPDLDAAERYAGEALAEVPYWHYVRDILMQQIRDARGGGREAGADSVTVDDADELILGRSDEPLRGWRSGALSRQTVPVRRPGPPLVLATFTLLTLIWGTTWAAIRVSLEGFPPFLGVGIRFLVAGAVLLLCMRLFGVRHSGTADERRIWILNTLFSFCGSYGIVYWAEQYVPSGLTAILFATFPLFVALLAHLWLPDDRLTPAKVAGILVGFAGVAVIFSEDFSRLGGRQVVIASIVMLGSPIVSAIASVGAKRYGAGVHPMAMVAVPMLMAGLLMTLLGAVVERGRPIHLGAAPVAALLYLALAGSAVTFTLYYWLMIDMPATRLALIAYTIPVVAVLVGVLFLREPLTARMALGGFLVVVGVATAARAPRGAAPPEARAAGVS